MAKCHVMRAAAGPQVVCLQPGNMMRRKTLVAVALLCLLVPFAQQQANARRSSSAAGVLAPDWFPAGATEDGASETRSSPFRPSSWSTTTSSADETPWRVQRVPNNVTTQQSIKYALPVRLPHPVGISVLCCAVCAHGPAHGHELLRCCVQSLAISRILIDGALWICTRQWRVSAAALLSHIARPILEASLGVCCFGRRWRT